MDGEIIVGMCGIGGRGSAHRLVGLVGEGLGVGVPAEDLALEGRQPRGEEVGDLGPLGATQAPTGGKGTLGAG